MADHGIYNMSNYNFETPEMLRAHCIAADKKMRDAMARFYGRHQVTKPKPIMPAPAPKTANPVVTTAANMAGVSVAELLGNRRYRRLVEARWAVMVVYSAAGWSMARIGRMMGGRDHTTIMSGLRQAEQLRRDDGQFAALVARLSAVFEEAHP